MLCFAPPSIDAAPDVLPRLMPPRKFIKRAGIALASTLVAIALLEGSLQLYGWYVRYEALSRLRSAPDDGRPIVAFCGDSNMFGLYLEDYEHTTLPKQIESLSKNATVAGAGNAKIPGIRSVNFGVPASPTWAVLEQVKRALELKPIAVVARCGINNTWQFPPGEGAGFLENLKLVKIYRVMSANKTARAKMNNLGPGGETLDDAEIQLDGRTSQMRLAPRDGAADPFEIRAVGGQKLGFDATSARMRADFEAMAALCKKNNVKLILATYLEGGLFDYANIRTLMLSLRGQNDIIVADCSPYLQKAIGGVEEAASRPVPREVAISRRSLLITRDRHPTALGYAVEARVVSAALVESGILQNFKPDDPLAPFAKAEIDIPKLKPSNTKLSFEVFSKPGDRVNLVGGLPGESIYKETSIPIDWNSLQIRPPNISPPLTPVSEVGPRGSIELRIPEKLAITLPQGTRLIAVIERGGKFGAARILISNTIEFRAGR